MSLSLYPIREEELTCPTDTSITRPQIKKHDLICDGCHSRLEIYRSQYICTICGKCEIMQKQEDTAFANYNNDSQASSPLKIVGREAARNQKHHIQKTSMYSKKKIIDSRSEFDKLYSRSSCKEKPPKMVYYKAGLLFNTIQETQVNRGQRRKGIQVACIWFKSKELGLSKDKILIAKLHKIDLTTLNEGITELEKFHSSGKIDIPVFNVDNDICSFIEQNFNKYNINKKYINFIRACVDRAREKHIGTSSGPISKCVGAIYFLLKLLEDTETINQMSQECKISKPTYMRFYTSILDNRRKFKCVFKKHSELKLSYSKIKNL